MISGASIILVSSWRTRRRLEVNAIRITEGRIPVPGGNVRYRRMGRGGVPPLLVHGGPGYPSDVLFEAFEPLAREREIVWYDQLGVGRSDPIDDPLLLTVDRFRSTSSEG